MIQWLKHLLQQNAVAQAPAAVPRQSAPNQPQRVRAEQGDTLAIQLALVIDLNVRVGCHACVTSCKQWNTSGSAGPLVDERPYGANPTGTFFNRVQTYEAGSYPQTDTVHLPKNLPALRRPTLRAGVPHGRQRQAQGRRHRAGGL